LADRRAHPTGHPPEEAERDRLTAYRILLVKRGPWPAGAHSTERSSPAVNVEPIQGRAAQGKRRTGRNDPRCGWNRLSKREMPAPQKSAWVQQELNGDRRHPPLSLPLLTARTACELTATPVGADALGVPQSGPGHRACEEMPRLTAEHASFELRMSAHGEPVEPCGLRGLGG